MSSECYVLDDWLLDDLLGRNEREAQMEAVRCLETLKEKCDRIAILEGSSWTDKAYKLMKREEVPLRKISKYLQEVILLDPQKCQKLHQDQVEAIPEPLREVAHHKDIYLLETYFAADASALVTTDVKLHKAISDAQGANITIRLRDEFLAEYLLS